ncbi:MAG: rhodanese-like domain-containing protein [Eubacteriales bacterium]|nr:rhodanese-like domain-containing protein [Eubacteriales bacterium]
MWYLISADDLEQYLDEGRGMTLVDMRDEQSYRNGHIRGAVNIPEGELMARLDELPRHQLIVLYCYHGPNSMRAARKLAQLGYEAADVYGGILAYRGKYMVYSR